MIASKKPPHYRPKRSLDQGNIFTGVCDSVHRGGGVWSGGLQFFGGSPILGGGVSNFSGDLQFFWGGSGLQFFGGSPIFGGAPIFRGGSRGEFFFDFCFLWGYPPPGPDTGIQSTFGRYASYWNAFLLLNKVGGVNSSRGNVQELRANHIASFSVKGGLFPKSIRNLSEISEVSKLCPKFGNYFYRNIVNSW